MHTKRLTIVAATGGVGSQLLDHAGGLHREPPGVAHDRRDVVTACDRLLE